MQPGRGAQGRGATRCGCRVRGRAPRPAGPASGNCSSQIPTVRTVTVAPRSASPLSILLASSGASAPWQVNATSARPDEAFASSTAGPLSGGGDDVSTADRRSEARERGGEAGVPDGDTAHPANAVQGRATTAASKPRRNKPSPPCTGRSVLAKSAIGQRAAAICRPLVLADRRPHRAVVRM
jgi:hypothetical protein